MLYYHGTTRTRAERICIEGFKPRRPSRRVWFAKHKGYAQHRARRQARRAHDRPVVLVCDLNIEQFRKRYGSKRCIIGSNGRVVAIDGPVSVSVLRSHIPGDLVPNSPSEVSQWVCRLLKLKPWKGPGSSHPGVERLARWISHRNESEPARHIRTTELVELAQQWLPEYFRDVRIDAATLTPQGWYGQIEVTTTPPPSVDDEDGALEEQAVRGLLDVVPKRRIRSLKLLVRIGADDLADWCELLLDDADQSVRVASLVTIARYCDDVDTTLIEPFVASGDIHLRAAAIAGLCRHAAEESPRWFRRGLKDPSPMCVWPRPRCSNIWTPSSTALSSPWH